MFKNIKCIKLVIRFFFSGIFGGLVWVFFFGGVMFCSFLFFFPSISSPELSKELVCLDQKKNYIYNRY